MIQPAAASCGLVRYSYSFPKGMTVYHVTKLSRFSSASEPRSSLIPPASIASAKFRHTIFDAACPAPPEVTFAQPLKLQNHCPSPCRESCGAQLSSSSVSPVSLDPDDEFLR
ncbi:uncharacterized protein N7511_011243 [Penicillium nucicola]|uniref:uncharacterized protein n=1 Tax=Penicillium nucicola TaxID=1850975 RepID=UPI0025455A65|nr:uncharacterized protein N7511_011243 [Penicillium nucicola]KAJ5742672.1 hypothetical protein N7511_011243 [Penicillium nucicola]